MAAAADGRDSGPAGRDEIKAIAARYREETGYNTIISGSSPGSILWPPEVEGAVNTGSAGALARNGAKREPVATVIFYQWSVAAHGAGEGARAPSIKFFVPSMFF